MRDLGLTERGWRVRGWIAGDPDGPVDPEFGGKPVDGMVVGVGGDGREDLDGEGDADARGGRGRVGKEPVIVAAAFPETVAGGRECLAGDEDGGEIGGVDFAAAQRVWLEEAEAVGAQLGGWVGDEEEVHGAVREGERQGEFPAGEEKREVSEDRLAGDGGKTCDQAMVGALLKPSDQVGDNECRGLGTLGGREALKLHAISCAQLLLRWVRERICHLPMLGRGLRSKRR